MRDKGNVLVIPKKNYIKLLKKYNPFIIFGLFCFFYYPPITSLNLIHVVGVVSIVYMIVEKKMMFSKTQFQFLGFFFLLFFYLMVFVGGLSGRGISSCTAPIIIIIDVLPFSVFLTDYFQHNNLKKSDLIDLVLFVGLLQAILAVISFVSIPIQSVFVDMIVSHSGAEVYYTLSSYRMYGFSLGLTFITPILQSIFAIIALVYAQTHSKLYYVASILMAFSALINARTSMVVLVIGVVVMALNPKFSSKEKRNALIGVIILILVIVYVVIPYISQNSSHTFSFINAGFMQLVNFVFSGKRDVGYFSYVTDSSNYRIPSDLGVLFGKGTFTMGATTLGFDSDVGYINDIWFGGLVYILLYYVGVIRMMVIMTKKADSLFSFIGLFLIVLFPVLNFKGMVFTVNGLMCFALILYLFSANYKSDLRYNFLR